ncbi:sensor histidine kinase [Streptomyces sp. NBC_01304]|uniref:sensor histidine kinase n=1 Tax=Streptomyces sp. NBC_01304 TaxID=2903818 RepID=UPI002E1099A9|nr:HAMP domain-containing histidine kinase [Streptomyces sp. NBC_01304]
MRRTTRNPKRFRLPLPRTVRARTAAAAALAMALLLAVGGGWLYTVLRANLLDDTSGRTELAARKAASLVDTGAAPHQLPAPEGGVDMVVVLDAQGRIKTADHDADFTPQLAALRPPPGQDSAARIVRHDGERRDVVVVRATAPDDSEQFVYAVTVLSDVDHATRAIGWALLASAPPLIGLAALIAWAVTGLALRPVAAIRTELDAVTAKELDRRVPEPPGEDEVALLARTANATLDRLEQSVGRQRQFVADASHELRNPIAAVRAQLETALADPDPAARRTETAPLRSALADTERLQRIAADLLLLARLDAQVPVIAEPVDLALLAAEELARRRDPRLVLEAQAPVPVRGDPARLERLLANLVDNALRYAATEVRVRAFAAGSRAVLEVTDDGPGIPEADRERVFDRFVRLDAARDRGSGGTGLGLAIAREIARAHGGDLVVATGPTAGACLRAEF